MQKLELDQPPNRYAASAVVVSPSSDGHRITGYDMRGLSFYDRQAIARPLASLVASAYRGALVDPVELTSGKVVSAISGIVSADKLLVLYDKGIENPTALLATTILTPESNPEFFSKLDFSPKSYALSEQEANSVSQLLQKIDGLFITNEMVVDYRFRQNGHSKRLRKIMLDNLREQGKSNIVMFGEIQNPSSIAQRLKYEDTLTVWAGHPLIGEKPRTDISFKTAIVAADIISRAYVMTNYPYLLPYYNNGILPSEMFDSPARMPIKPKFENPYLYDALQVIVDRQSSLTSSEDQNLRRIMHTKQPIDRPIPFSGLAVTL
ncbi:MAG TPA: hypothetical protein VMR41_00820 [Patescibacteria group bacterium]|nr:hypothetical protein [Patescibacteria group bacterium]